MMKRRHGGNLAPDQTMEKDLPTKEVLHGGSHGTDEWQIYRNVITLLYWEQDLNLRTVRKIMEQRYGFDKRLVHLFHS
jgi:hypothetical protein